MLKQTLAALAVTAATLALMPAAQADITIGITLSATGPGAALGIPMKNSVALYPSEIAGEKLKIVVLDDAGDPAAATTNARRLATEDNADAIIGSALTPATIAVAGVANEIGIPHFACSPMPIDPHKSRWSFVMPQDAKLIAGALFKEMKKNGVKTVGYIGFSDSYGDLWINQLKSAGKEMGLEVAAEERYARPDTSVSGQALKLMAAHPDAILVGASGTGAALPQIELRQRGYKGTFYQTHGAVTGDFIRVAGKAAEGTIMASGPVMVAELQEGTETKAPGLAYVQAYEARYGAGTRTQFGAHINDAMLVLEAAVPVALKSAKPGTAEFRAALRDAIENAGDVAASQGVYHYNADNHNGLDQRSVVVLTVKDGKFELVK
jgi:branched-chain amino acid transport system substrate-binding protein